MPYTITENYTSVAASMNWSRDRVCSKRRWSAKKNLKALLSEESARSAEPSVYKRLTPSRLTTTGLRRSAELPLSCAMSTRDDLVSGASRLATHPGALQRIIGAYT